MSYALPVLALLLAAGVFTRFLRVRFVEALPMALMGIGIALYVSYIAGVLHYGFIVILVAISAGTVWLLVEAYRNHLMEPLLRRAASPQVVAFLLVAVVLYFATRETTSGLWDELRLWAAYPKILHGTDVIQVGSDAQLFPAMQSYLPGMPLLVYFFLAFSPDFHEPMIFFAYGIVATAFVLPAARLLTWAKVYWMPLAVVALVGVPLYFWNSRNDFGDYTTSLYIDTYLGIIAGFGCYLVATGSVRRTGGRIALALTVVTLFLFKESGLSFSIVLCVIALVQIAASIRWRGDGMARPLTKLLTRSAILIVPLVLAYLSWKIILESNGVAGWTNSSYLHLKHSIRGISEFAGALVGEGIVSGNLHFYGGRRTVLVAILMLLIVGIAWAWLGGTNSIRKLRDPRTRHIDGTVVATAAALYVCGFLLVYAVAGPADVSISYILILGILIAAAVGLYFRVVQDGNNRRRVDDLRYAIVAAAVINVIYVVGLYFLTTGPFQGVIQSFARYMSTAAVLSLTFLVLYASSRRWTAPSTRAAERFTVLIAAALAVLIALAPLGAHAKYDGGWDDRAAENASLIVEGASADMAGLDKTSPVGVYVVFVGDPVEDAGLHHRIYFDLLGSGVLVRNFFSEAQIATETKPDSPSYQSDVVASKDLFGSKISAGDYDYVYFVQSDGAVAAQYREDFSEGTSPGALYRIDRSVSPATYVRVNQR